LIFKLGKKLAFPSAELAEAEGILAVGGDLSVERLMLAYRSGIFPWYSEDEPILWWSPDPRFILYPDKFKVSNASKVGLVALIRQLQKEDCKVVDCQVVTEHLRSFGAEEISRKDYLKLVASFALTL